LTAVNGRLVIGSTVVDNGADPIATISQAQQLVQAANALADKYSLVISSGTTIGQGKADGPGSAAAALQALINNGAFTSSDAVVQQILNASRGKSAEQFEENLQFADVYKAFSELQKPANAAADAIRETAKAYQEAKTKAQELGLSVSALQQGAAANVNQDMARQIKAILDPQALALEDFADVAEERLKYVQEVGADMAKAEHLNMLQRQQILQQGLQGMTGTLRQWLDNQLLGATSNLTGIEKLSEAQTQFESAKSAGNTNRVVELADYIANLATELYGGTLQGAQLVDWTRSQVKEYGKSLGLPGFAVGTSSAPAGWAWVGENGPELMRFRGGEQVLPHRLSVAVANNNMPGESREDFIQLAMLLASINADTSVLRRDLPVNNDLLRNLVDRLDRYLTAADQMKRVA
uniref:hypothetical protein n=1 Tax=Ferrovibrio sp. TaxID=1917215 RepID=UPI0035B3A97C